MVHTTMSILAVLSSTFFYLNQSVGYIVLIRVVLDVVFVLEKTEEEKEIRKTRYSVFGYIICIIIAPHSHERSTLFQSLSISMSMILYIFSHTIAVVERRKERKIHVIQY